MRAFSLSVVVSLLWLLPACSVEDEPQSSCTEAFGHVVMEGSIQGSRPVIAHVWFETDDEGDLWLSGTLHETAPRQVFRFRGSASEESELLHLELTSATHGGEGETMGQLDVTWNKGSGTDLATLAGSLHRGTEGGKSTIQLREITPPGSVRLEYHRFEESYHRRRGDSVLHRQLCIVLPQIRSDNPAHATINAVIRHRAHQLLVDPSACPDVSKAAPSLAKVEGALRAELPDRSQPNQMAIDRQETLQVSHVFKVLHNQNGLLCLRLTLNEDLGGAHGMVSSRHLIFDLTTGRTLQVGDLLIEGWQAQLTEIAREDLRAQFGLDAGVSLTAPGLLNEEFQLNDNLFISQEGLGFYFSPYEIAPFSFGAITPLVPLHKISHLIRRDSVLWHVQQSQPD